MATRSEPFPPRDGLLLFTGDSLTDAFRRPEERNDAYRLGAGYALLCGGCLQATATFAGVRCDNRGVAGDGVARLAARWDEDCVALAPAAISVLVGINDALRPQDAPREGFAHALDALLARTRARLPTARIALVEPFALPIELGTADVLARLRTIQAAVRAAAAKHGARFVALQDELTAAAGADPAAWCYDGVHATARGHWLIARRWLGELAGIALP